MRTATGAHQRVRMRRLGQGVMLHGTVQSYDVETGAFTALFDVDQQGATPTAFAVDSVAKNRYTDHDGRAWELIN